MTQQLANVDQLMSVLRRASHVDGSNDRLRELLFGVLSRSIQDLHHAEPILRYDAHDCLLEALGGICDELGLELGYLRETVEKYYLNYRIEDWLLANDNIYTAFCDGEYMRLDYQDSGVFPVEFLLAWEHDYISPTPINPCVIPADPPPVIATNRYKG